MDSARRPVADAVTVAMTAHQLALLSRGVDLLAASYRARVRRALTVADPHAERLFTEAGSVLAQLLADAGRTPGDDRLAGAAFWRDRAAHPVRMPVEVARLLRRAVRTVATAEFDAMDTRPGGAPESWDGFGERDRFLPLAAAEWNLSAALASLEGVPPPDPSPARGERG